MSRTTSIRAFHAIKANGLLSKRRMQVYHYLYQYGPATAKDIYSALKTANQNRSGYDARLSELKRMTVVTDVGETQCKISGQQLLLWDVTPNMPIPLSNTKTKPQIVREELEQAKKLLELGCFIFDQGAIGRCVWGSSKEKEFIDGANKLLKKETTE